MKLIRLTTVGKIIWFFLALIVLVAIIGVISLFKKEEPKKIDNPKEVESEKIIDYTDSRNYIFDFDNEIGFEANDNLIVIKDSGTYKFTGSNQKYNFIIDSPHGIVKIIFSKFDSNIINNLINVKDAYKLIIEIEAGTQNKIISTNFEQDKNATIISSLADIDIIGTGSLSVESGGNFLSSDGNINFKESTLEVNKIENAFLIKGNFKMENGTIYILADEEGFKSDGNLIIEDGNFIVRSKNAIKNGGIFIINKGMVLLASLEEIQKPNANSVQKSLILNFKEITNKQLLIHDTTKVVLAYAGGIDYQHILYSDDFKVDSYVLYGNAKIDGEQKYGLYKINESEEDTQLTTDNLENDRFLTNELVNIYDDIVKK